jgi:hypothetical protein
VTLLLFRVLAIKLLPYQKQSGKLWAIGSSEYKHTCKYLTDLSIAMTIEKAIPLSSTVLNQEGKQTKNKKQADLQKRCACMKMDRYPCHGTLRITVDDSNQQTVKVFMKHSLAHEVYTDISLPAEVAKIVEEMKDLPPSQVQMPTSYQMTLMQITYRFGPAS